LFTGIIEEIGEITAVRNLTDQIEMKIRADKILENLKVSDSINIDGACQTVVNIANKEFTIQAVGETLTKTTMGNFHRDRKVNLERSLRLDSRLGGHFVQGHINGIGSISKIIKRSDNYYFEITIPENLIKYCAPEGSIAIDGISLTIAQIKKNIVGISVIPYTFNHTTLNLKSTGEMVNIETDILARQMEQLISKKENSDLSMEKLINWGY
jgi:riboflavin synthase